MIEKPWDDVDIIGHQLTPYGMQYLKWDKDGSPRRSYITVETAWKDAVLRQKVDAYHLKKKGKGEQPWPLLSDPSWPVCLQMLRNNPVKGQLIP